MSYKEKKVIPLFWECYMCLKVKGYLCTLSALIVSVGFVTRRTFLYHVLINIIKLHLL